MDRIFQWLGAFLVLFALEYVLVSWNFATHSFVLFVTAIIAFKATSNSKPTRYSRGHKRKKSVGAGLFDMSPSQREAPRMNVRDPQPTMPHLSEEPGKHWGK